MARKEKVKNVEKVFYTQFTSDNQALAEQEVTLMFESVKCCKVISIDLVKSSRACRNAFGKEMDDDTFDAINSTSEEAWFNDYDFVFKVNVNILVVLTDEDIHKILERAGLDLQDGFEE